MDVFGDPAWNISGIVIRRLCFGDVCQEDEWNELSSDEQMDTALERSEEIREQREWGVATTIAGTIYATLERDLRRRINPARLVPRNNEHCIELCIPILPI
jgi:hypothetical protein